MKTIALLIASLLALPALAQPLALPQDHPAPAPGQRRPMGMGMMPPNHPDISSMMPTSRPAATHGSLTVRAIQGSAGGGPVAGDAVTVELFHQGQAINRIEKQLDASGVLVLEKLPLDLPFQPIARIRHAGLDYQQVGREMHGHNANQQLDITVFEQTDQAPAWQVRNRHVIIKPVEQGLGITEMLSIESPGDRTWRGTADEKGQRTTLWLELPAGAQNITIGGGFDECCTRFENSRLLSSAPLMPGASQYQVSYILAPSSGQLRMAIKNPAPAKHLMLAVPDDGTTAKVEGMKLFRLMPGQNGNMRIYQAADLAAGQETSVTFSGLASGKTVSNAMKVSASSLPKVIVAVVAGVVLLLGVSIMFIKPKAAGKKA